jgi:nucleoside-diphosphate-sugar epimerase
MKILLFGGSGLVSQRVLQFACEMNYSVIAVTRGEKPLPDKLVFDHIASDRDNIDLDYIIDSYDYDVVIDVMCQTELHARQSVKLAKKCKRMIMVSTDYVYDPEFRQLFLKEQDGVFSDRQDYGGEKRRAEEVILNAHAEDRISGTILRPPHIYGPGSFPGPIPKHGRKQHLLKDIEEGVRLHLLHGGLGLIQPIHADDFARIILDVINKEESYGQAYNASGPELMTHLEYYKSLAQCIGKSIVVDAYCPEEGAEDVNHYVAGHRCYDMSKLNALLPNFSYTPFSQGMEDWVRHLQSDLA